MIGIELQVRFRVLPRPYRSPQLAGPVVGQATPAFVAYLLESLVDVNGLGRPKEVSGKEEDLQQW